MVASWNNHLAVVRVLLARNVKVDAVNKVGETALIYASHYQSDRKNVIWHLLKAGADYMITDTISADDLSILHTRTLNPEWNFAGYGTSVPPHNDGSRYRYIPDDQYIVRLERSPVIDSYSKCLAFVNRERKLAGLVEIEVEHSLRPESSTQNIGNKMIFESSATLFNLDYMQRERVDNGVIFHYFNDRRI